MAEGHPGNVAAGSLALLMAEIVVEVQRLGCWGIGVYRAD